MTPPTTLPCYAYDFNWNTNQVERVVVTAYDLSPGAAIKGITCREENGDVHRSSVGMYFDTPLEALRDARESLGDSIESLNISIRDARAQIVQCTRQRDIVADLIKKEKQL